MLLSESLSSLPRSFGRAITTLKELKEAIGTFIATAACKLRKEKLKAHFLIVFINKERFKSESATIHLPLATAYTPDLIKEAHALLERIFREGNAYKKGGVMFSELVSEKDSQLDLFEEEKDPKKKRMIIETVDRVNDQFGEKIITFAAEGIDKKWKSSSSRRSPSYTTCWKEIPSVIV